MYRNDVDKLAVSLYHSEARKQLVLGERAPRWGGRLVVLVTMLAPGRHSTSDLHRHWPIDHVQKQCGCGRGSYSPVIEHSIGLGGYCRASAFHISS